MTGWVVRASSVVAISFVLASCASNPPVAVTAGPRFPAYSIPDVPAGLQNVDPKLRAQHELGWQRLQAGDLRGATREFSNVVRRAPEFYPSATGLGFVALADRQYKTAATRFTAVLAKNDAYLPAWLGQSEAQLGLKNDEEAIAAMERVIALDPKRVETRSRLDLVRFRHVQTLLEEARAAGKPADQMASLRKALTFAPQSTLVLRELAALELKTGALADAESHARRAIQLDAGEVESQVLLAQTLEAQKKYREASTVYGRAAVIEPGAEWSKKAAALSQQADIAALPAEFQSLSSAPTVTRAHVAALIGVRLRDLIEAAPKRPAVVATDMRTHWASPWVIPVTRAGVMDVYANHTFQPAGTMRRVDLAQVASKLIALAGARSPELTRWQAARPRFADLPATNVSYRAAALAAASGVLPADDGDRYAPTRPATGAELEAAVARVMQIAQSASAVR